MWIFENGKFLLKCKWWTSFKELEIWNRLLLPWGDRLGQQSRRHLLYKSRNNSPLCPGLQNFLRRLALSATYQSIRWGVPWAQTGNISHRPPSCVGLMCVLFFQRTQWSLSLVVLWLTVPSASGDSQSPELCDLPFRQRHGLPRSSPYEVS